MPRSYQPGTLTRTPLDRGSLEADVTLRLRLKPEPIEIENAHVLAWREALEAEGIVLSVWRIHRRIGMSGGLLTNMLLRETGHGRGPPSRRAPARSHAAALNRPQGQIRPLPGAQALLAAADRGRHPLGHRHQRPHGDRPPGAGEAGRRPPSVPVVTRDQVKYAKPDPDLFLAAAERLGVDMQIASWWATASGTCWPPGGPGRWASACCPAATAQEELEAPAPTASTRTPPTCSTTWTKWACAGDLRLGDQSGLI